MELTPVTSLIRAGGIALALVLAACASPNPAEGGLPGTVESVTSGDTLVILVGGKKLDVRLADIGAPQGGQFFAPNARTLLAAMVEGRSVTVRETGRTPDTVFAYVRVGEINVNLQMVQRGAAWVCWEYTLDTDYMPFENRVRQLGTGVWQNLTALQARLECRARPPGERMTGGASPP